jgi:Protein of unknown function (DUF2911)
MRRSITLCATAAALSVSLPPAASAQTRGFVVRLGVDTFAVERITRTGNTVQGAVARHTPTATVLRYTLVFNPDSSIASYEESIYNPDGSPAGADARGVAQTGMKMTFMPDSVVREVIRNGAPVSKRDAAPGVTLPAVGGTSPYWQELAIQAVRRHAAGQFGFFGFALGQNAPATFPVRLIGSDSAEVLFPQGFRRGYKMDGGGRLVHGDATNTTVRLQMTAVPAADIDAIARGWAAREVAGNGMPIASPRDSVRATIGDATVTIDYGRPFKRGRRIWGALVPFDTVWRLGANVPTQLRTDRDLEIGGITVHAGSYSVWLVPSAQQESYLLINAQTSGWVGVPMHDASRDIAKIPVTRHTGSPPGADQFRIVIQRGTLMMLWDDRGYDVSIRPTHG